MTAAMSRGPRWVAGAVSRHVSRARTERKREKSELPETLQEGFSEEVSPALGPSGQHVKGLTRQTRQSMSPSSLLRDRHTPPVSKSLSVPPVWPSPP